MKRLLCIAALALATGPVAAQVSIGISEPGVFGRIDLGGFPQPQLLNAQPVYAERPPGREIPPPIYLHVPPGYERDWRDHCREYDACGQPVFFVRDDWYRNVYRPRYREVHGYEHGDRRYDGRGERREDGRDAGREAGRDERHDERRDDRREDNGRDR